MNEGLEALKCLYLHARCGYVDEITQRVIKDKTEVIEQELEAYYELESMHEELAKAYNKLCQEKLEWLKQKKALEIIKEKRVNLEYLKCCENYEQYKIVCSYWDEISEQEFDLLKEVLL